MNSNGLFSRVLVCCVAALVIPTTLLAEPVKHATPAQAKALVAAHPELTKEISANGATIRFEKIVNGSLHYSFRTADGNKGTVVVQPPGGVTTALDIPWGPIVDLAVGLYNKVKGGGGGGGCTTSVIKTETCVAGQCASTTTTVTNCG